MFLKSNDVINQPTIEINHSLTQTTIHSPLYSFTLCTPKYVNRNIAFHGIELVTERKDYTGIPRIVVESAQSQLREESRSGDTLYKSLNPKKSSLLPRPSS
jgi:hypothetical protein